MKKVDWRRYLKEAFLIVAGSFVFALGVDCFEVPNGLAAGGLTGLATILAAIAASVGITLPVGLQLAPVVPVLAQGELLISAIWGGVLVGAGVGIVFLSGGNTGGTDIVAQLLNKPTGLPLGTLSMLVDGAIVLASIPVFSVRNALYAGIAMYIGGVVIDMVVDGPRTARVAYIISHRHDEIANKILYEMGRGCTELQARGVWSGNSRPVLMCVLGRTETARLKGIVAELDPDAIVIVSEVHEAFGEGFGEIGPS